jgi:photosystem II stability/assembly factor-like uncharacterized protein
MSLIPTRRANADAENRYHENSHLNTRSARLRASESMNLKPLPWFLAVLAVLLIGISTPSANASGAVWTPIGPDGGDARRFAFDPRTPGTIYLGTTDSWIYVSGDGGSSWSRLAHLGSLDNLVVDSLAVDRSDPNTLFAGTYVTDQTNGGVYISHDRGHTWTESDGLRGQAVFALAQAPSRTRVLVAGTLQGVFRSDDKGLHWRPISPPGSKEVHEVQSVAIDPYDPDTVYAGTWHLPWKTTDGGAHWSSIKQGLIDDSDVFSMIVDQSRPSVLFLSACSGIYRTDDFGGQFRKVQGIPSTARRTRVLTMDPTDRNTVYAGTTEGLYKTTDGGDNWTRTTGADVIINDVYVDPGNPKHVLLATDRGGVVASEDAAVSFEASNTGFSQRQVAALLADAKTPGTVYAGVINGKSLGGVFITTDSGHTWKQQSDGLDGRDVFLLAQSEDGTLLAGTSDGVYRWSGSAWASADGVSASTPAQPRSTKRAAHPAARTAHHHAGAKRAAKAADPRTIQGRVTALAASGNTWYATTARGLFRSTNDGASWDGPMLSGQGGGTSPGLGAYTALAVSSDTIYVSRRQDIMVSDNRGVNWKPVVFPAGLTVVDALTLTPNGMLWAGGREGLFYSSDHGRTWGRLRQLPVVDIDSLAWDSAMSRIMLASRQSTVVFAIDPADKTWKWWNAGWTVHGITSLNGRLLAASQFSGVVAAPETETASTGSPVRNAQQ